MSLIDPTITTFWNKYKTYLVMGGLAVLLVGVALFLYQCGDNYFFESKIETQKDGIANTAGEIVNVSNQIANLELKKEGLKANLNTAAAQLEKDIFGHEAAKKETNQALANFHESVNANSNIDRSLDDLNKVLDRLEQ